MLVAAAVAVDQRKAVYGSVASVALMIAIIGVIPEPAAIARYSPCRSACG